MKSVHLEQIITKIGNSNGVIIPAMTMRELGVEASDVVEIKISPKKKKLEYDIKQLVANTDFEAQRKNPQLKEWDSIPVLGREIV